jgi:hypothetical protein
MKPAGPLCRPALRPSGPGSTPAKLQSKAAPNSRNRAPPLMPTEVGNSAGIARQRPPGVVAASNGVSED